MGRTKEPKKRACGQSRDSPSSKCGSYSVLSGASSCVSATPHDESFWTTRTQRPSAAGSKLGSRAGSLNDFSRAVSKDSDTTEIMDGVLLLDAVAEEPPPDGESSLIMSITSLLATCIGTGVLALPFAFEAAGPGLGAVILVLAVVLSMLSSYLLVQCCDWVRCFSYEEIMIAAFGRSGAVVMEVTVLWLLLGAMTSLLVVTADALELAFGDADPAHWWKSRTALLAMDVVFVVIPLSWVQSPHSLRYSNSIAVTCTSLTAAAIIAHGIASVDGMALVMESPLCHYGFSSVQAAPIIMLSLGCQVQVPCVYGDLKGRSLRRMGCGLATVGAACFLIYGTVSILGIAAVKPNMAVVVPGNILDGFPGGQPDALLMRCLTGFAVTLVYPMLCLPCRSTLDHLCFGGGAAVIQPPPFVLRLRHAAETISVVSVTFFLATCNTNLASVIGFTGATAGSLICYMLPPLAFLKLSCERPVAETRSRTWTAAAVFLLVCTMPTMLAAVWQSYSKYRSGTIP